MKEIGIRVGFIFRDPVSEHIDKRLSIARKALSGKSREVFEKPLSHDDGTTEIVLEIRTTPDIFMDSFLEHTLNRPFSRGCAGASYVEEFSLDR